VGKSRLLRFAALSSCSCAPPTPPRAGVGVAAGGGAVGLAAAAGALSADRVVAMPRALPKAACPPDFMARLPLFFSNACVAALRRVGAAPGNAPSFDAAGPFCGNASARNAGWVPGTWFMSGRFDGTGEFDMFTGAGGGRLGVATIDRLAVRGFIAAPSDGFDGFDGFDKLTAGKLTAGELTAGELTAGEPTDGRLGAASSANGWGGFVPSEGSL